MCSWLKCEWWHLLIKGTGTQTGHSNQGCWDRGRTGMWWLFAKVVYVTDIWFLTLGICVSFWEKAYNMSPFEYLWNNIACSWVYTLHSYFSVAEIEQFVKRLLHKMNTRGQHWIIYILDKPPSLIVCQVMKLSYLPVLEIGGL